MLLTRLEPFEDVGGFLAGRLNLRARIGEDLSVDVYEEQGEMIVKMGLPIINLEDLDISLEDDALTISGRREEESAIEKKDYYSKEIRRGSFSRIITLPKSVDASRARAQYKNGLLVVTVPVVAGAKEKAVKISVQK